MTKRKKHSEETGEVYEEEHDEEREAASKEYEEKMADVEKPEPPEDTAASHEGKGIYVMKQDANVAHKDYKAGDQIYLTYEEYQALRNSGVYCDPA